MHCSSTFGSVAILILSKHFLYVFLSFDLICCTVCRTHIIDLSEKKAANVSFYIFINSRLCCGGVQPRVAFTYCCGIITTVREHHMIFIWINSTSARQIKLDFFCVCVTNIYTVTLPFVYRFHPYIHANNTYRNICLCGAAMQTNIYDMYWVLRGGRLVILYRYIQYILYFFLIIHTNAIERMSVFTMKLW